MGTYIHGLCMSALTLNLLPVCVKLVTKLSNEWSLHVYIETSFLSLNSQVSLIFTILIPIKQKDSTVSSPIQPP